MAGLIIWGCWLGGPEQPCIRGLHWSRYPRRKGQFLCRCNI